MTTAWAHLPNAAHIDSVIASANANPEQWVDAWEDAWDVARHRGRVAACKMIKKQGRNAIWDAAFWVARDTPQYAATDAILALIAYDECAYMLESDPGELAILAAFSDPRASLLLPACKVFHSLKTIA